MTDDLRRAVTNVAWTLDDDRGHNEMAKITTDYLDKDQARALLAVLAASPVTLGSEPKVDTPDDGAGEYRTGRLRGLRDALAAIDGHNFRDTAHDRIRRVLAEAEGECLTCGGSGDGWGGPGKPMTDCGDCDGSGVAAGQGEDRA